MPLDIVSELQGSARILGLKGRLDVVTSDLLQKRLREVAGEPLVVLDLAGVDYVSSAGLRVLLAAHDELPRLVLSGLQEYVREVLEVAGLDTVFETAPSVAEAAR